MRFEPLPAYQYLTDPALPLGSRRYRASYGGRGSAKSWEYVNATIFHALTNPGLRVAFLREVQANLEESSHELVRKRLEHYGLLGTEFGEVNSTFVGRRGQKIMFKGLWKGNKPEGIKSLEGIDLSIVEEATEVTQRSLDVLIPTVMRTKKSEVWPIWNPCRPTDPVDRFFRGPVKPPAAIVRETSWRDNPHFPEGLKQAMALDFRKDKARAMWIWGGEYMPAAENAIWSRDVLDAAWRMGKGVDLKDLTRIVVGVDPSGGGDDVGIVVAGKMGDTVVVLADCTVPATSPLRWATAVGQACAVWKADCVVAEANYGGDMVKSTLEAGKVTARVQMVTATRGKAVRAEPVAALYEKGKVLHREPFPLLEAEMTLTTPQGYQGEGSPNRMDALVWCVTELALNETVTTFGSFGRL
jgi:hypothetical protein